jgi:hypothetical protein
VSLLESAANGLLGAAFTGLVGFVAIKRSDRKKEARLELAWESQANELDERVTAQFKSEIEYLRTQLGECQSETRRLQRLIGKLQERRSDP